MNNLQQKLDHLKWLSSIGVEYYCSDKKDSKNSLITTLEQYTSKKSTIVAPTLQEPTPEFSIMKKQIKTNTKINNAVEKARNFADKANNLDELRESLENFNECALKNFANNTVFSDGVKNAPILLVGEAPGATEDKEGIPFCGESGKLLDKMLATIGISRESNAYITNTIFWRPPANRRPTNEEIEICKPFVEKHIALISPKLIILVGSTATSSLLGKNESMSKIRQTNHSYINKYLHNPIHTTALFHPAYLLRQPMQKKATWHDLLKIQEFIQNNYSL